MVNRHRTFWSNMSDGSAELGVTDENYIKHVEECKKRNEEIYTTINNLMNKYPINNRKQTFHEICNAMRKVKEEYNL